MYINSGDSMFNKEKSLLKDSFFDDINGKKLDKYQRKVVIDNSDRLLVVAGAGSGKTLTIVAKVKYLIEKLGYQEQEILCLSFTNETVNNLKDKLNNSVEVLTFHKLALKIINSNHINYFIASDTMLQYIINEYFSGNIVKRRFLLEYFDKQLMYDEIMNSSKLEYLKNNILSFIKKIKCNDLGIKDIKRIIKKCVYEKEKIFLIFTLEILKIYQEELLSELKIDFDDMIRYAKDLVRSKGLKWKYRYIIIDEYQDISQIRFNLINEILKSIHAKLMCVGDDYQSIYGFSGSNVSLFIDFFKLFPKARRIDIKNTYRNSYQLIKTSVKFIMKNDLQLKKHIKATFFYKNPVVLVYYDSLKESYDNLLNYLYLEEEKNILVLARYNNDFKLINRKEEHQGMNIKYLTVHMAKGLESDVVILLKVSDEYLGFPSKIKSDNIFSLIDNNDEEIPYAEERRLFYVALTRCKKRIFLLVPKKNPSIFIDEIRNRSAELLLK